ncbi:MYG1 exonuclease isoform X2 [Struthio camelus]|uniref:MYG1 exonuclease isoform X2 n=1 Tax=Struthio camelus TaxID=8801 RepID=UPI003603C5CB
MEGEPAHAQAQSGACAVMWGALRAARRMAAAAAGSGAGAGSGSGSGSKRPRCEPAPRIGTHDGTFHCDEALACYLLRLLPRYRDAEVVRTRDPQRLAQCDVVVDVGGEYDPERHRYDHHQRSFTQSMQCLRPDKPWTTKLSSAGLVYCHFGSQILAGLLELPEDSPVVTMLYDKLYENFVEEIDAIDNGISQRDGEPRYALTTNLSARVGHLNPRWNDPDQDTEAGFKRAMELVGGEFMERLDYYHRAWLPARALVEEAIQRRFEVDTSGEVLEFPQGGCPWKEHIFSLEKELALPKTLQLVLYPDRSGQWRVQSVPVEPHAFESRLPLPEPWRGIRDEALSQLTGIPGCVFVHASGFIGGNRTREGALEMARRTLAQRQGGDAQSS